MAVFTPFSAAAGGLCAQLSGVSTLEPVSSLGLGLIRRHVVAEQEHASPSGCAGAGIEMVVTPPARAIESAWVAASSGLLELGDKNARRLDQRLLRLESAMLIVPAAPGAMMIACCRSDSLDEDVGGTR